MTRAPRVSRFPVASFGPELLALLIAGAEKRVEVPIKTFQLLTRFQQRIHMLRSAMGREKHPNYELVQRARTSRMWDTEESTGRKYNFRLIVEPNDSQFAAAISEAGVTVNRTEMQGVLEETPQPPRDPSTEPSTSSNPEGLDPYAAFKG